MKKRKWITIILCTIVIITILIIIPFINIKTNENIISCEKYNNLKENDITISELAVEVCGSDNKRYWTVREACKAWVKYYWYTCPWKASILQLIIDKLKK